MAETTTQPDIFKVICLSYDDMASDAPEAANARIETAYDELILNGLNFEEAKSEFLKAFKLFRKFREVEDA